MTRDLTTLVRDKFLKGGRPPLGDPPTFVGRPCVCGLHYPHTKEWNRTVVYATALFPSQPREQVLHSFAFTGVALQTEQCKHEIESCLACNLPSDTCTLVPRPSVVVCVPYWESGNQTTCRRKHKKGEDAPKHVNTQELECAGYKATIFIMGLGTLL